MDKRLWEINHPYYMTSGNYFEAGWHREFKTLDDFLSEFDDADLDYNWVVRWDWLEGEDWGAGEYRGDDYYRNGRLMIQMIGQRKALMQSFEVAVCRADEPRVREYLNKYWTYMQEMWAPFSALSPNTGGKPE